MQQIPGQGYLLESVAQEHILGAIHVDQNTNRKYKYCKANEALAEGAILTAMLALVTASDCAASVNRELKSQGTEFLATQVGAWVKIIVGTIAINDDPNEIEAFISTAEVRMKTNWSASLTTAEDFLIYHPYWMEECDAAGERIFGVAPIAVTSGYFFWMQIRGNTPQVKVDGNTGSNAIVAGEGIISGGGASGQGRGLLNAGTTTDEAEKSNIIALVGTTLVAQTVPAILDCPE